MSFESSSFDSSWVVDTLQIGDIFAWRKARVRPRFSSHFAVLLIGSCLPVALIEIPGLDDLARIFYHRRVRVIHESGDVRRSQLEGISEVLLELIGIVGSVIWLSGEFPVRRIRVPKCIGSGGNEDGFGFVFVLVVGYFTESSEVVFERKFIDESELPIVVIDGDASAEFVVIDESGGIPGRFPCPAWNFQDGRADGDRRYLQSFLSDHKCDAIQASLFEIHIGKLGHPATIADLDLHLFGGE